MRVELACEKNQESRPGVRGYSLHTHNSTVGSHRQPRCPISLSALRAVKGDRYSSVPIPAISVTNVTTSRIEDYSSPLL